jgi:predicted AAA+ superfamily ATPase
MEDVLARIAAALERLAPAPPEDAPITSGGAYLWAAGVLRRARAFDPLPLVALIGVDAQKTALAENSRRHAAGLPAHDALLWGARGAGKSALVKAATAANGLTLIETPRDELASLPRLFDRLAAAPRRFVLFADDLSFEGDRAAAKALRSLLDGGVEARPPNCRLYVTSNRRHLVERSMAENDPVNPRDAADDALALADRFGLSLGFHAVDQTTYLAIAHAYAERHGLPWSEPDALSFAHARGSRSGRVAWQWAVDAAGRAGVVLGTPDSVTPAKAGT